MPVNRWPAERYADGIPTQAHLLTPSYFSAGVFRFPPENVPPKLGQLVKCFPDGDGAQTEAARGNAGSVVVAGWSWS